MIQEEEGYDKLERLQNDVSEIKDFLLGGKWNSKGVKQRLENLEDFKKNVRIKLWGLVGGFIAVIIFILKWIL